MLFEIHTQYYFFIGGNKKWKTQAKDPLGFMYAHLLSHWKDLHSIQRNG